MSKLEFTQKIDSPIGQLTLVSDGTHLTRLLWPHEFYDAKASHTSLTQVARQLDEYFAGKRKQFNLKLDLNGSEFQRRVWHGLQNIPYGETRSYQQLADCVGNAKAYRAVGNANGKNPIPIVIPCHRVTRANGDLGGFGGGSRIKAFLLSLENSRKPR